MLGVSRLPLGDLTLSRLFRGVGVTGSMGEEAPGWEPVPWGAHARARVAPVPILPYQNLIHFTYPLSRSLALLLGQDCGCGDYTMFMRP